MGGVGWQLNGRHSIFFSSRRPSKPGFRPTMDFLPRSVLLPPRRRREDEDLDRRISLHPAGVWIDLHQMLLRCGEYDG